MRRPLESGETGFTLIELLIVIGIIGFLAAAILVAVDPVKRIQDSRDARRYAEVNALLNAMLNKQVDDRALYDGTTTLIDASNITSQVIVSSISSIDCTLNASAPTCPDAALPLDNSGQVTCVANLSALAPTYIASLPIDPIGSGNDPTPGTLDLVLGATNTGYYINRNPTGNRITIGACHGEQDDAISVSR